MVVGQRKIRELLDCEEICPNGDQCDGNEAFCPFADKIQALIKSFEGDVQPIPDGTDVQLGALINGKWMKLIPTIVSDDREMGGWIKSNQVKFYHASGYRTGKERSGEIAILRDGRAYAWLAIDKEN